jgi:hypothetical protein
LVLALITYGEAEASAARSLVVAAGAIIPPRRLRTQACIAHLAVPVPVAASASRRIALDQPARRSAT